MAESHATDRARRWARSTREHLCRASCGADAGSLVFAVFLGILELGTRVEPAPDGSPSIEG